MPAIVLAGDWHADSAHAVRVIDAAADAGAIGVAQVGDFGYWPRHPQGRRFLGKVAARCVEKGISVWFADGNHEDHSSLDHRNAQHPVSVAPSMWWVPRGTVMEWAERRVMFMGGAVSVDQPRRVAGIDWFPEEAPTELHVERALRGGPIDVVVAHEGLPDTPLVSTYRGSIPPEIAAHAGRVREVMGEIADALRPRIWAHGHWHHRMTARRNDTVVECLNESRGPFEQTTLLCDLATMETTPLRAG